MREIWARRIVIFTGLIVLILAIVFARIQNPTEPDGTRQQLTVDTSEKLSLDPELVQQGRLIYQQQNCVYCHSITGRGNPRNPLDGVGTKHSAQALGNWIVGADALPGVLPESVKKIKLNYRNLNDDDLAVLIIYMQSLR